MYNYTTYGLTFRSSVRFPELPSLISPVDSLDITIKTSNVDPEMVTSRRSTEVARVRPDIACLSYDEGDFLVRDGSEVVLDPAPDIAPERLRQFVLGPVFGMLLYQRDHLVLHGSAVSVNGAAVAFVGESGSGKSTLAASFAERGHEVLADDLVVVTTGREPPRIIPGPPVFKLDTETCPVTPSTEPVGTSGTDTVEKRYYRTGESETGAVELNRIYLLETGGSPATESLSGKEKMMTLVRQTYVRRVLEDTEAAVAHFGQCEAVVRGVPVSELRYPRTPDGLRRATALVEAANESERPRHEL